jgi:phosphogluconate dehydratase
MHPRVLEVTERLIARSRATREAYLALIRGAASDGPQRGKLQCANFAHGVAGCGTEDKNSLRMMNAANVAIVSSYNDMLSAHQPYEHFPEQIKKALREIGSVGQFAGGTPAMCDGVTQGEPGMELSLLSREVIALSTAVALSHNMFDAALMLGICDKIVPGLLMGALRFGHLPTIFVPGGPMPSGISNKEKADVRQRYAEGKASREELLESEMKSYHSPGTCTFYGTANTNQLLMEVMGLHLPGASFVNPYTPLRDALTREAAHQVTRLTKQNGDFMPLGEIVDERSLVNSIVALHATGGSTNHTLHMPAIAMSAGIQLTWQDMADLSEVVPTLSHVYPNGKADINHFQAAGGMAFLIRELLEAGLLHEDVNTVAGYGLSRYTREPFLVDGELVWREGPIESLDESHPASGSACIFCRGWPAGDGRQPGPWCDEGFGSRAGASDRRSPGAGVPGPAATGRCVQGRRAGARLCGRDAFSGAAFQRHARAAQDDAVSGCVAGPRLQSGTDYRRADVRRIGQDPGSDPCQPRGFDWRRRWRGCRTAT